MSRLFMSNPEEHVITDHQLARSHVVVDLVKTSGGVSGEHSHDDKYVKLVDYEDSDVLDKVKSVDGPGSGLDADLLDGSHASAFASSTHNHDTTYLKLTDYTDANVLAKVKNVDGSGSGLDADLLDGSHASAFASASHNHDTTYLKLSDYTDSNVLNKIKNVDGSGSGLDADLLDGQDGGYYAPETVTTLGTLINAASAKTSPADADNMAVTDSTSSHVLKKITWSNIKAALKSYFDTLYLSSSIKIATGSVTLSSAAWTDNISFGVTFNSPPKVVISPSTSTTGVIAPKTNNVTTTTFSATIGGSGFSGIVCHWIAIGT